ncbi:hypothetical protein BJY00DRAFT_314541 [Aspergillus carlsbadensis]|nr:hypothetical protein BJY00DRAFT_314541 [Aspergillus carlsbadensis]
MLSSGCDASYNPLTDTDESLDPEVENQPDLTSNEQSTLPHAVYFVLSLIIAFTTGALLSVYLSNSLATHKSGFESPGIASIIAPHIPLAEISAEFTHHSPFSKEPPREGNVSEPIWDALIPNGLGYFIPAELANTPDPPLTSIKIPSVFHQLHCLYLLRRAYYTDAPPAELQRFDFGRNRSVHVAHCFGYLAQAITCSADSTLEPAVDTEHEQGQEHEHGFLGAGFARRCWNFAALKSVVERGRVFDARGFLAWGLGADGRVPLG